MQPITLKGTFLDKLSNEEFFQFCQENRDLRIERTQDLAITIMSPTGSLSGFYNAEILAQLVVWNRAAQTGVVFDSSTGFLLPDQSVRSPDAAWVGRGKWEALTPEQRRKFAPICPDFVIELRSATDSLEQLQGKMLTWLANGCAMGWLVDMEEATVYQYFAGGAIQVVKGFDHPISGEPLLPNFALDLSQVN